VPRDRPVTLQDIALRAGVSKMTVSLALRGHPHAAAATRDRLRRLADEMGYRPNPLIVANMAQLRAGRRTAFAGTVAIAGRGVSPERMPQNTQSRRVFMGARRRAEALGYKLEWFSLATPALDGRRLTEILKARGIFGVVLFADGVLPPRCHLDWSQFALSAIGRTEVGCELHRTAGDYYRAVRDICQRCRELGYRRIGLTVTRDHDTAHQSLHRSALLGCQAEWPASDHVPPLVLEQWEAAPFHAWLERCRPEVIIAGADRPWHWLLEAGYRIPEDIGFIRPHFSDHLTDASGFIFDEAELGAAAVDLVVEQLNHNERGIPAMVKRVLLPGRWFEGKSLRRQEEVAAKT
jgi:DNA-binding LacI/PurR family transcriptional regulator